MNRVEWLQEARLMRFEEAYEGWTKSRLTQEEAANLLGVCSRTFRRYVDRYEEEGLDGLCDRRLSEVSHRRAPVDEVMDVVKRYAKRGAHRKRRESSPWPGMMLHQDGSTHEWVAGQRWDLIVTMDDATNEHYSMFFCEQEGTRSSFRGVREVIESKGLFCSLYTDRGSHYWHTPQAGGKVDKNNPTQFGPRMGSDEGANRLRLINSGFNPRSPHGERHWPFDSCIVQVAFQSTLPAWGATIGLDKPEVSKPVSIHAPRMGSDLALVSCTLSPLRFNPRAPNGARRTPGAQWLIS